MKNKTNLSYFLLLSALLPLAIVSNNDYSVKADSNEAVSDQNPSIPIISIDEYESNIQGVHSISYTELMNKISNKDTFILFVGYKECKYCRAFSPELKELIQKDGASVYYLDWDSLRGQNINDPNFIDFIKNDLQLSGTPTIALLQNGVVNQNLNFSGYGFTVNDLEAMLHPDSSTTSSASSNNSSNSTASSTTSNSSDNNAASSASSNSSNNSVVSSTSSHSSDNSATSSASSNSSDNSAASSASSHSSDNSVASSTSSHSSDNSAASSTSSNSSDNSAASSTSSHSSDNSVASSTSSHSSDNSATSSVSSNNSVTSSTSFNNSHAALDNHFKNYYPAVSNDSNLKSNLNITEGNGFVSYTVDSQSSANNIQTTDYNHSGSSSIATSTSTASNSDNINDLQTKIRKRKVIKLKKQIHQLESKEHNYRHKLLALNQKHHNKREVRNFSRKIKTLKNQIKTLLKQLINQRKAN